MVSVPLCPLFLGQHGTVRSETLFPLTFREVVAPVYEVVKVLCGRQVMRDVH